MSSIKFKNGEISLIAKVVQKGDYYGKDLSIVHNGDVPLVEFFDARYPMTKIDDKFSGQFISRYDLNTFNHVKTGIFLDSGSLHWSLKPDTVTFLQEWICYDLGITLETNTVKRPKP